MNIEEHNKAIDGSDPLALDVELFCHKCGWK
jgi:hypothetical protein